MCSNREHTNRDILRSELTHIGKHMKLSKSIFVLILAILSSLGAYAETIKFQVPACINEDLLDEFSGYIYENDTQGMMQLIKNEYCIILYEGDNVSLINYGFTKSTIRVNGVKYYLPSDALSEN